MLSNFVRASRKLQIQACAARAFHSSGRKFSEETTVVSEANENDYLPVFKLEEKPLLVKYGFPFLMVQNIFWGANLATTLLSSIELTPVVPTIGLILSLGATKIIQNHIANSVAEVAILDENSAVRVKQYSFTGTLKTRFLDRSEFMGLPKMVHSSILGEKSRFYVMRVKEGNTKQRFLILDKKGLFDTSGVLDPLLGYNVTTLERCPPSEPYNAQTPEKK